MADLKLDLDAVTELGRDLSHVADEFENVNAHSDRIAEAVGHGHLAKTVRDFAHKWDDTRAKMTENLRLLADTATQVSEAFTQTDADMAKALADGPAQPPHLARANG